MCAKKRVQKYLARAQISGEHKYLARTNIWRAQISCAHKYLARTQISCARKYLARTNIWRAHKYLVRTQIIWALADAHLPRGHVDDFDAVGAARGDLVARGAEGHVAQRVAVVLRAELLATDLGELW